MSGAFSVHTSVLGKGGVAVKILLQFLGEYFMSTEAEHPWKGDAWEDAAESANRGMNGQGYIVDSMMRANRAGSRLTWVVLALMFVQIAIAVIALLAL